MSDKELIKQIFKEIEESITKTSSSKPVLMKDSNFIKELKRIKEKYV